MLLLGPALSSVAVLGISAAMLPSKELMLQNNYRLNTALILDISYSFVGIALYLSLAVYGIMRRTYLFDHREDGPQPGAQIVRFGLEVSLGHGPRADILGGRNVDAGGRVARVI